MPLTPMSCTVVATLLDDWIERVSDTNDFNVTECTDGSDASYTTGQPE